MCPGESKSLASATTSVTTALHAARRSTNTSVPTRIIDGRVRGVLQFPTAMTIERMPAITPAATAVDSFWPIFGTCNKGHADG